MSGDDPDPDLPFLFLFLFLFLFSFGEINFNFSKFFFSFLGILVPSIQGTQNTASATFLPHSQLAFLNEVLALWDNYSLSLPVTLFCRRSVDFDLLNTP